MKNIEFGVMTFADVEPNPEANGTNPYQRIQSLLEEIQLADKLGIDVFGLGEHHRPDYAVSSPSTVLAAAAALTNNIKLTSAVTVLSSEDPVRVFQQFSSLDLISGGRAEIMAGRGSFIESFPLFGYDLEDYDELFEEKLQLLLKINDNEMVSWDGNLRPSINNLGVYPRPYNPKIPVWLAAGGSPASAVRAAKLKLPLTLAIIGGAAGHFIPFIDLYKKSWRENGNSAEDFQLAINNHVFVGENDSEISDIFYPYYAKMMDRVGRTRGWQPMTRQQFEFMRGPQGSLMVGSVEKVAEKLALEYQQFGFTRFLAHIGLGTVPHEHTVNSIRLYAEKVIPEFKNRIGY